MTRAIAHLNTLSSNEVESELLKCCGSSEWARRMARERPFDSVAALIARAENIWFSLAPHDWLEAFRSHPKIGSKKAAHRISAEAQKWSEQEQSGANNAGKETMQALAELNQQYEEKFGYIFIVCATGKSSEEMVSTLRERLENHPDKELSIAATEQAKITELRLNKLLKQ